MKDLKYWIDYFVLSYRKIADSCQFKEAGVTPDSVRESLKDFRTDLKAGGFNAPFFYNYDTKGNPLLDAVVFELRKNSFTMNSNDFMLELDRTKEIFYDLDTDSMAVIWSKTKQVYCFDEAFARNLYNTENICVTEDILDYLPSKVICIDVTDSPELCEELRAQYLMCYVDKADDGHEWNVHITKINDYYYAGDVFTIENKELNEKAFDIIQGYRGTSESIYMGKSDELDNVQIQAFDRDKMHRFVLQALVYLASERPDLEKTTTSKAAEAKFKRSGKKGERPIGEWKVGERFGNAFRKWEAEIKSVEISKSHKEGTGTSPKMPYVRRAHWHTYIYNVRDEQGNNVYDETGKVKKVARPRWVYETFCNLGKEDAEKLPITKHKVHNNKKQEGPNR